MHLIRERRYTFNRVEHSVRIHLCDGSDHINRVDADVGPLVAETDQSVVEEHIEPLFVEVLFLLKQVSLATVDKLVVTQVFFEPLNDPDSELHVMLAMCVDQLADLGSLVGTLLDQGTVRSKEVFLKELVELNSRTLALR